jgi:hypothetical protein
MTQHHVGGLAADSWQLHERVDVRGHLAPVLLDERPRHADDGFRLLPEKPGLEHEAFDVGRVGAAQGARVGIPGEEGRRDHVHALVGRLRREDRGDEQLEGVSMVQLGIGVRVLGFELRQNRPRGPRRVER